MPLLAAVLLAVTILFVFLDGLNDSANLVSTVVSSRALSPGRAVFLAAAGEFVGACVLGSAVAETIGREMVSLGTNVRGGMVLGTVLTAIVAASAWGGLSWAWGLPCSSTHALLGGWLGAFMAQSGFAVIQWGRVSEIFIVILLSPLAGFLAAWALIRGAYRLLQGLPLKIGRGVRFSEWFGLEVLSLAHGANDGQKSMAVLVAGLALSDPGRGYAIPVWVRLVCSLTLTVGVVVGARRTVRTLGFALYRVHGIHSLCSQAVSGAVLLASTLLGFPLSTGQVVSSSIMGVGAGVRPKAVRWDVAVDIALNWIFTLPASAALSYIMLKLALASGAAW